MAFIVQPVANRVIKRAIASHNENEEWEKRDLTHKWVWVLDGEGTRTKKSVKVKRTIPVGISENDKAVLSRVKHHAKLLDESINFFGIKIGWSSVVGLFPLVGDFSDMIFAVLVMASCKGIDGGISGKIWFKMVCNIIFDFLVGILPIIGDIGDALFRANAKNYNLLEDEVTAKIRKRGIDPFPDEKIYIQTSKRGRIVAHPKPVANNTMGYTATSQADILGPPPRYEARSGGHNTASLNRPALPEPAKKKIGRGWFSRTTNPEEKNTDLEMGESPPVQSTGVVA